MSNSILSAADLSPAQIELLFSRADKILSGANPNLQDTRIAVALFNVASPLPIRTDSILVEAGAQVNLLAPTNNFDEIARQVNGLGSSVLFISSPLVDSATKLATQVQAAVLNAGEGTNENPVRGLMDAYAIYTLKGDLKNIRIAMLGNLKFSAEAHSLARILGLFGARISFVTPAALSMPYDLTDQVRLSAYEVEETNDLATTLRKTDVLYLSIIDSTRVEKKIYDKLKDFYALVPATFAGAKDGLVILGEWDGAPELLAPTRRDVERAARAMLLAMVESASGLR